MPSPNPRPNFDPIARPYRWIEYLTFGPLLQRTRTHFLRQALQHFTTRRQALILGDGDGRFTATLLATCPHLHVLAVDTSSAMLTLLRRNASRASLSAPDRLSTKEADASEITPSRSTDLIVTHFFVDCLTQPELNQLAAQLANRAAPQVLWLLSDFRIPPTGPARLPARILVRSLYLAFRFLTGLHATHLPDHAQALTNAGFVRIAQHHTLLGILTTELWRLAPQLPSTP